MHEFRHFKDDEKSGYIGLRVIANNDTFWKYEFNGYMEELKIARSIKAKDQAKQILKEMRKRKDEIYGNR